VYGIIHFLAVGRVGSRRLARWNETHDESKRPSGGPYDEDKLPDLVADRIVNNDSKVGFPYTDAEFWNPNREAFMSVADELPKAAVCRRRVQGARRSVRRPQAWRPDLR
jgi:hypothetical protein